MSENSSVQDAFINEFLIEANEYLSSINSEIMALEKSPDDSDLINSIYRKIHTIKGGANFAHFQKLMDVTHAAESLLDQVRNKTLTLNSDLTDTLLSAVDVISELLKQIESTGKEGDRDMMDILERLILAMPPVEAAPSPATEAPKPVEPAKEVKAPKPAGASAPTEASPKDKKANNKTANPTASPSKDGKEDSSSPTKGQALADSVIRVDVNLLDKIMNVVGELVLNRNQISQFANANSLPELTRLVQQLDVITTELQEDIMTTRMQPVGSVFTKFERIVRDLARETGKKISLVIEGKDTELDKTLLEAIKDPLTHLVRNAIDHGIEKPAEREANGKPETGSVVIRAYHEGGQVSIEIKDDGKGIPKDKILQKAIDKGIITSDRGNQLNEKQIFNLLFAPGFSTAEQVTNISGRGVGMDVVKTNVEKIGGKVDIQSVEGHGSTFKLRIPLTLAIVPALTVQSHKHSFAIPQINIMELVRLEGQKRKLIETVHGSEFFRRRGELIPIVRLDQVLNLQEPSEFDQITDPQATMKVRGRGNALQITNEEVDNIVVLSSEGRVFGLVVERIVDQEEIVVKPLSHQLKETKVFAGATIMGDGSVALILDAAGLAVRVHLSAERTDTDASVFAEQGIRKADQQEMLLVRLADGHLYGVPLAIVNRLEEFRREHVEYVGEQAIVQYRNKPMPMVSVYDSLGLTKLNEASKRKDDVLPCIVIVIRDRLFGLMVEEILDITHTEEAMNTDSLDRDGLLGSIFIDGKTVTVLDIYSIIAALKLGVGAEGNQENRQTRSRKTILLAEDSPFFRSTAMKSLREEGYSVVACEDGQAAYDYIRAHPEEIGLLLSDIEMPRMTGWELASRIRDDEALNKIPMMAMTTRYSREDQEKGRQCGFSRYLQKFNRSELLDAVESLFRA